MTQISRAGIRELLGEIIQWRERADRGDHAARGGGAEVSEREVGTIRREDREHVAFRESARGESGGDALDAGGERGIRKHAAGWSVDERGFVAERARASENEFVERDVGDHDVGVGAAMDHLAKMRLPVTRHKLEARVGPSTAETARLASERMVPLCVSGPTHASRYYTLSCHTRRFSGTKAYTRS